MIYVTSDLHGYSLDKFKRLLNDSSFGDDDFLFVLGDVIDKGDDGIEILKWLMLQPNAELILGNHEAMMLSCSFLFDEITEATLKKFNAEKMHLLYTWQANGAEPTIRALSKELPETRRDIIDYISECPVYDNVYVNGKEYLLVHAGFENYQKNKKIDEYTDDELLWARPKLSDIYSDKYITIFGHTPTCNYGEEYKGEIIKTDTWMNIDTGSACGLSPMLLRLDDMREFYILD